MVANIDKVFFWENENQIIFSILRVKNQNQKSWKTNTFLWGLQKLHGHPPV